MSSRDFWERKAETTCKSFITVTVVVIVLQLYRHLQMYLANQVIWKV